MDHYDCWHTHVSFLPLIALEKKDEKLNFVTLLFLRNCPHDKTMRRLRRSDINLSLYLFYGSPTLLLLLCNSKDKFRLVTHLIGIFPSPFFSTLIEQIKLLFLCLHDVCGFLALFHQKKNDTKRIRWRKETRTLLSRLNLSHSRLLSSQQRRREKRRKKSLNYKEKKRFERNSQTKGWGKGKERNLNFQSDKISLT